MGGGAEAALWPHWRTQAEAVLRPHAGRGGGSAVAELADGVLSLGGRRCSMARLRLFLAGVVGVNERVVVLLDFGGILGEATLLVGFYGFGEEFV